MIVNCKKDKISKEITIEAIIEHSHIAVDFIENILKKVGSCDNTIFKMIVVTEEIFANIVNYAYCNSIGKITICCTIDLNINKIFLCFIDQGIPFNPLVVSKPNIHSELKERKVGVLGIYIIKEFAEKITYEYRNGKNIVTIIKRI